MGASFVADATWDLPGRSRVAGQYKGAEEIVAFLAKAYGCPGGRYGSS